MGSITLFGFLLIAIWALFSGANGQLRPNFYATTCPSLESTVKSGMQTATAEDDGTPAAMLRMHFHDCFVKGCDGSILLDDTLTFIGEKTAFPNVNSVRLYEVIDSIKAQVESRCPGVVSCADILALAAREAVVMTGGRTWALPLGRRDGRNASWTEANRDLPGPSSSFETLVEMFRVKGLNTADMITLSGGHSIGRARCSLFRAHIYGDSNVERTFAEEKKKNCPSVAGTGDDNKEFFDVRTPNTFDNRFYVNLLARQALLHSDQELFDNNASRIVQNLQVIAYSVSNSLFLSDFGKSMIKMGNISPLTGTLGEIRANCRVVNS